jgi:uncharacterized protein (DUF1501 family)
VVIYLAGGNDGLNTVAPYGMGPYYDLRPRLAIKEAEALPLAGKLGLHPNLKAMKGFYDAGRLTIVQGVGYPNPDRSHFRSYDIWATGQTKGVSPVGWLGRYLDLSAAAGAGPLRAVAVGASVPKPLVGGSGAAVAIESLNEMKLKGTPAATAAIREMYGLGSGPLALVRGRGEAALAAADALQRMASGYKAGASYPKGNPLGNSLQLIVKLLAGGGGTQVLFTTFGAFDEHAGEKAHHDNLMLQFDQAVAAYQQDLAANGLGGSVLTLVYSEFGRRAKENGSGGTDHGTAAPVFLLGDGLRGGLVGEHPSLTDLQDFDLKLGIDFRSIYATLLAGWLGQEPDAVLGQRYERLPLLKT